MAPFLYPGFSPLKDPQQTTLNLHNIIYNLITLPYILGNKLHPTAPVYTLTLHHTPPCHSCSHSASDIEKHISPLLPYSTRLSVDTFWNNTGTLSLALDAHCIAHSTLYTSCGSYSWRPPPHDPHTDVLPIIDLDQDHPHHRHTPFPPRLSPWSTSSANQSSTTPFHPLPMSSNRSNRRCQLTTHRRRLLHQWIAKREVRPPRQYTSNLSLYLQTERRKMSRWTSSSQCFGASLQVLKATLVLAKAKRQGRGSYHTSLRTPLGLL